MSQAALAMSQATLSAVANAFAPIGLTDVVFRAGKDVIELLLKIHDSPTELSHLISSIQVLESAIAETRAYLDDFAASRFVSDDAAVPDITYILQRCQSEFDQLRRIADATTAGPNDSWLLLWRKKASFALNEKDIERSQRRLERYAYALDTALSANKGKNQIHIRNEISAAREDVGKASDRVLQHVDVSGEAIKAAITTSSVDAETKIQATLKVLEDEVTTSASALQGTMQFEGTAIRHDLHDVATAVNNSVTLTSANIETTRSLVTERSQSLTLKLDAAHDSIQRRIATSSSQQRQGFVSIHKGLNRNHTTQSTAMGRQLRETHRQGLRLKQMQETVMQMASITIAESTDNGFQLSGVDAEKLMFPLTLIKSQLTRLVPMLTNIESIGLSAAEFGWVQQEFHALLAQASLSQHHSAKRASGSFAQNPDFHRQSYRPSSKSTRGESMNRPSQCDHPPPIPRFDTIYSLDTPFGTLCLSIDRSNGQGNIEKTESVTTIRFAFLPRLELCSIGFTTLFTQQQSAPPFSRYIHVYNVVPKDLNYDVLAIIKSDNVLAMQDLLSWRKLSPSDAVRPWNEHVAFHGYSWSLALYALHCNSHRTFNFLLQQGAHVQDYSIEPMSVEILLPKRLSMGDFHEWSSLMPKALEAGFDIPTEFGYGALDGGPSEVAKQIMLFLRHHRIHFSVENSMTMLEDGILASLCNDCMDCGDPDHGKYELLEFLVKQGADVNTRQYNGRNALHSLVLGSDNCVAKYYHQRTVQLLLKSGCDPNAVDGYGMAPIDHLPRHKGSNSPDMHERLEEMGFELLVLPRVHPMDAGIVARKRGEETLPVSNLTHGEYMKQKRDIFIRTKSGYSPDWEYLWPDKSAGAYHPYTVSAREVLPLLLEAMKNGSYIPCILADESEKRQLDREMGVCYESEYANYGPVESLHPPMRKRKSEIRRCRTTVEYTKLGTRKMVFTKQKHVRVLQRFPTHKERRIEKWRAIWHPDMNLRKALYVISIILMPDIWGWTNGFSSTSEY